MKRFIGLALCVVLVVTASCNLFNPYKEMNTSSLEDSGGTAPSSEADAIAFVNDFLGIMVEDEIASLSPRHDPKDLDGALKAYLLSKVPVPKNGATTTADTFAFNVDLGYKGPVGDNGTADVKGGLKGVLPYDGLVRDLEASTHYSLTGLMAKLLLSGDLKKLEHLGDYSLVHGKLKNDGQFDTDVTFTSDSGDPPAVDFATLAGNLELKLKMSNGFSVKNTDSGEGVKFTVFADDDVTDTWENLASGGTALEGFAKEITFTINVYNDADSLIGSEELSLYDLMS